MRAVRAAVLILTSVGAIRAAAGTTPENEPDCANGTIDTFNAGCNAEDPVFSPISLGETILGTTGTFLREGSRFRDTDWYQLDLSEPTRIAFTVDAEADMRVGVIDNDGDPSECNIEFLGSIIARDGFGDVFEATLTPGRWWLVVAPERFHGVPCGTPYTAELSGEPVCLSKQPGDLLEGEPACGPGFDDAFNAGCNTTPPSFSPLPINKPIWGTSGTYAGGTMRDTDWYELVLPVPAEVTWTVDATFPVVAGLIDTLDSSGDCSSTTGFIFPVDVQPACSTAEVTAQLEAGTWYWFVGPNFESPEAVACGAGYRAMLSADIHLGCNKADLVQPYGGLDIDDVLAFLGAFALGEEAADLAEPYGVFDVDDVLVFLSSFAAGCPDPIDPRSGGPMTGPWISTSPRKPGVGLGQTAHAKDPG